MDSNSLLTMETDNCEDMILLVDADSVDDMRSVLRAVRKKCRKMDLSLVVDTSSMECGAASDSLEDIQNPEKLEKDASKRYKTKENATDQLLEKHELSRDSVKLKKGGKEKKLNGRLKRLFDRKERIRSTSESTEDMKAMDDVDTDSTDSGIDMTDMIKNFDDHVTKSDSDLSCGQCGIVSNSKNGKRKRNEDNSDNDNLHKKQCIDHKFDETRLPLDKFDKSRIVALDCEFVGVGPRKTSGLGRCSIVNYDGKVLCDMYAQPEEPITDYRTRWSGIRRKDLVNAVPFSHAQKHIRRILQDKIIVGHALHFDFCVLGIYPPARLIRDTSKYIPLRKLLEEKLDCSSNGRNSLKIFSKHLLGRDIQGGEHCSVEDSIAALDIYKLVEDQWEADAAKSSSLQGHKTSQVDQGNHHSYFEDCYWPDDVLNDDQD